MTPPSTSARPVSTGRALDRRCAAIASGACGLEFDLLVAREGAGTGVARGVVEFVLDTQQLVVLGGAVGAGRSTGLDLPAVHGHGEVGDRGVLGLAGAVAHHAAVTVAVGEGDRVQRLGERA